MKFFCVFITLSLVALSWTAPIQEDETVPQEVVYDEGFAVDAPEREKRFLDLIGGILGGGGRNDQQAAEAIVRQCLELLIQTRLLNNVPAVGPLAHQIIEQNPDLISKVTSAGILGMFEVATKLILPIALGMIG